MCNNVFFVKLGKNVNSLCLSGGGEQLDTIGGLTYFLV